MRFLCVSLILLCLSDVALADDIHTISQRLKQWRESIQTIQCEVVESESEGGKAKDQLTIRWAQTSRVLRWDLTSVSNMRKASYYSVDGVAKTVSSISLADSSSPLESGSIQTVKYPEIASGSPWLFSLHYTLHTPHPRLHDYLLYPDIGFNVKRVRLDNVNLIQVDCVEAAGKRYSYFFDPTKNYLPVRSTTYLVPGRPELRVEYVIKQTKEVKPGIWFPLVVERAVHTSGQYDSKCRVEFRSIRINEPIDEKALEVQFPENLLVIDSLKGERYTVGADQKPIPGTVKAIPLSKDEQDALVASRPWYKRLWIWLVVGGGLFVMAALYVVWRYRQRRAQPAT